MGCNGNPDGDEEESGTAPQGNLKGLKYNYTPSSTASIAFFFFSSFGVGNDDKDVIPGSQEICIWPRQGQTFQKASSRLHASKRFQEPNSGESWNMKTNTTSFLSSTQPMPSFSVVLLNLRHEPLFRDYLLLPSYEYTRTLPANFLGSFHFCIECA